MDSYSLDEIKNIIDKNLLTPEVLKNVLKSTTRRIEVKGDMSAVEILKYLSNCKSIPEDTRDNINKYLAEYDSFLIKNQKKDDEKNNVSRVVLLYLLIVAILAFIVFLILRGEFYVWYFEWSKFKKFQKKRNS